MAAHGLKNEDALPKYPDFEKKVMSILEGDRTSEMKKRSINYLKKEFDTYSGMDEASFLNAMVPLIVTKSRTVETEPMTFDEAVDRDLDPIVANPEKGTVYRAAPWSEDGMLVRVDANLDGDLLPHVYEDNELNQKMAKKDDDMKTPRPDRIYGLDPRLFILPNKLLLDKHIDATLDVCDYMHHPFFLIEGKSNRGNPHDAANQARRGGATIVNALRCAYAAIGKERTTLGPDYDSFMFSGTVSVEVFNIWLHWAEVKKDCILFHMDLVHCMAFNIKSQYANTRKLMNNIFCWGCNRKERGLLDLQDDIIQWQKVQSGWAKPGEGSGLNQTSVYGGGVEEAEDEEESEEEDASKKRKRQGKGIGKS